MYKHKYIQKHYNFQLYIKFENPVNIFKWSIPFLFLFYFIIFFKHSNN